uniref:Uncharacterized protein n=1 Tax=Trichogramma kaykai TaxID=54128 RepID=A0ABD2X5M5_9HYME
MTDKSFDSKTGQEYLEHLKSIRVEVNWEIEEERENFYRQFCSLIGDWKGRHPDLREIFRREEIEWMLTKSVKTGPNEFICFVIRTGYKDEPDLDEDGKLLLLRNTPVHYAAEHKVPDWISKVCELFKIYDKFNVNYTNESGFTHFHVACMSGCDEIVEKFLELGQDPNISMKETGDTSLHLALENRHTKTIELLLRNGANPNLAKKGGSTCLHYIALLSEVVDDDLVEKFFQIIDDIQLTLEVNAQDDDGITPLVFAASYGKKKATEWLLRKGADPNLTDAWKNTSLHFIAVTGSDYDFLKKFFEICSEIQRTVKVDALEFTGQTPLHLAIKVRGTYMVECLLRNGADPNIANPEGLISLHLLAMYGIDVLMEKFFEICNDMQLKVLVNAQENKGRAPLHMGTGKTNTVKCLLRNGADPNSADLEGLTYLHYMALRKIDDDLEWFFEICDNMQLKVQVDARTNLGNTPLHMALTTGNTKMIEALLRRGADINLTDKDGSISLHIICIREYNDDLMKTFFKITDDLQQTVQVDARDKWGRTPLQTAVANLLLNAVDVLLDRGADLSSFIFPSERYFCERFDVINRDWDKLRLASGALAALERLEDREYDLSRSDVLTIIKLFVKYGLFEKSSDLSEKCRYDEEEFTSKAKEIIMIPSLSLYDLIQLRPEEEDKLLTYTNYFEVERSNNLDKIPEQYRDMCLRHLCEKMSRRYFKRLALDAFQELIHYRLPILCCHMVIENLKNEDLFKIYEAGEIVAKRNGAKTSDTVSKGIFPSFTL